jgi:hypothetical protein
MYRTYRGTLALTGLLGATLALTGTAWAGRVSRGSDPGFELHRIVSLFQGGTSEAIAPSETQPSQPIQGETLLFGMSNVFPEGVRVVTFRPGAGSRQLQAGVDFTFTAQVVTPEGTTGSFTNVVLRFPADRVALIQDAQLQITIQPQLGPGPTGDVIEGVTLRSPR